MNSTATGSESSNEINHIETCMSLKTLITLFDMKEFNKDNIKLIQSYIAEVSDGVPKITDKTIESLNNLL